MTESYPARVHQTLTSDHFPTPRMAIRNNLTLADVSWFAAEQAEAANTAADFMDEALRTRPKAEWPDVFKTVSDQLEDWRYQLALAQGTASSGDAAPRSAERFRDPITDDSPNIDPVGPDVGFWHKGYEWDEALGRYAGGEETPASRLVAEVGAWANTRFDEEGNLGGFLQNWVRLPNGDYVRGNCILRKEAAREQNRVGIERAKASGVDTSRFDVNGDFIYIRTGTKTDRETIRLALYGYLGQLETAHQQGEIVTVRQWAEAAYLFYQSPRKKKGSDAVNRVYPMALASRWLPTLPVMPDDIDWRAYTKGQDRFVEEVVALNAGAYDGEAGNPNPYIY